MKHSDKSFKAFKKFLNEKRLDGYEYSEGKYDRKIYNWFELGKPIKVKFYNKAGKLKVFNLQKYNKN